MGKRTQPLLEELRAWCKAKWGRQRQAAAALEVSTSTLNDWLAQPPRKHLTGDQALAVLEFVKKKRRGRKPRTP